MEHKDEIIIYWSREDEAFIAELASCMADGKTYKEALAHVQIVINEWLETAKLKNKPIPQSKGKLMYA